MEVDQAHFKIQEALAPNPQVRCAPLEVESGDSGSRKNEVTSRMIIHLTTENALNLIKPINNCV